MFIASLLSFIPLFGTTRIRSKNLRVPYFGFSAIHPRLDSRHVFVQHPNAKSRMICVLPMLILKSEG